MRKINGTNMARKTFTATTLGTNRFSATARIAAVAAVAGLLSACGGGNYAATEDTAPRPGPTKNYDPKYDTSVFGAGGASLGNVRSGGGLLGGGDEKARLPVNKYLWQAALDTLSFLPLVSTDPFTGVIATDWGATPGAPGERFKVTAYILNPNLSAASLKVAVFREISSDGGPWVPAPVSADTPRQLEDAILTRARQIKIAEVEGGVTG
jgi:hypothetical protein